MNEQAIMSGMRDPNEIMDTGNKGSEMVEKLLMERREKKKNI